VDNVLEASASSRFARAAVPSKDLFKPGQPPVRRQPIAITLSELSGSLRKDENVEKEEN